jgi:hypothetical protein
MSDLSDLLPRKQKFVMLVAGGKAQNQAYAEAYDKADASSRYVIQRASKLAAELAPHIGELQRQNAAQLRYDAEAHLAELNSIIEGCKQAAMPLLNSGLVNYGSFTPVVLRAVELKGKMFGLYPNKHEISGRDGKPLEIKQIVVATGARA